MQHALARRADLAKLSVGEPADALEQEAHHVVNVIVRMWDPPAGGAVPAFAPLAGREVISGSGYGGATHSRRA